MPPHALPRGPIYTSEHITGAYPAELQPTGTEHFIHALFRLRGMADARAGLAPLIIATTFSTALTFPVGAWPHMVAEHAALHDLELNLCVPLVAGGHGSICFPHALHSRVRSLVRVRS